MPHASTDALTPERWRRAQAAFHDAVDRSPAARAAALDATCADDPALRLVVEEMIAADTGASAPFEALPDALGMVRLRRVFDNAHDPDPTACAGRQVGAYRLLRELGRGGMGTVYLAERTDVARRVALKLVRGGLAAPERVARFRVEQRVLAGLDHPHIARLLDAGVADDGTPFFAMEYVDGEPIDRYCDRHRLSVAARLALVEQACGAVAFAHRNLVVHRDLKPSNLLVTADGEAKLLDFGIAKLLAPDAPADAAPLTAAGVRWMTPEYAAPEQAAGTPVTTAADVYALGVVAYELLVGARPSRGAGGDRLPPRPSTAARTGRVGANAAPPGGIAAARATTPALLARQLAGDLDAVVLKALDPDPARRYASAAELLDDLRRHRTGFPVRARPESRAYRARLFARRNRWGVGAAAGAVVLLAATAGALAVAQARTAAALARATEEAAKAREVTRFVTSLFQDADPYRTGGAAAARPAAGAELADLGSERIGRELARQPAARVELLHTLAVVQRNRGQYDQADSLLRRALDARRSIPATRASGAPEAADAEVAGLLHDLGIVRRLRNDFAGADTLLTQALAIRLSLPGVTRADLAATRTELGTLRRYQGRYAEARTLLGQAIAAERLSPGPALADAIERLAMVDYVAGDVARGITLVREAIPIRERWLGRDHPAVARSYSLLATLLTGVLGATAPADSAARRALELQRRWLPAGHPDVLTTESTLSLILLNEGALLRAEQLQRAVLAGRQRLFGRTHRDVAGSLAVLGHTRRRRGDLAGAMTLLRQSADIYARVSGPDHADVQGLWKEMAQIEVMRGDERAALVLVRRLLAARHAPVWDPVAQPLAELASVVADGGIVTEADPSACARAAPLTRRALAAYRARHPDAPSDDVHLVEIARGPARRC